MQLSIADVELFFRLQRSLMSFVNQRLQVVSETVATPEAFLSLPPETRLELHEALLEHRDLIDDFADANPSGLDEAELAIVRSWRDLVAGSFFAFRQLRDHMIFLSEDEPVVAYGVVALFTPFEDLIGTHLPVMLDTTLLPFKGRIVYDGLIASHDVRFGGGVKRRLNEEYKEAKEGLGIITSLPAPAGEPRPTASKRKGAGTTRAKSPAPAPAASRPAHDRIVALTDAFCRDHLDDEYATLCRKLAGALARKRPSPLTRGKPESWASGIVRAVGFANFLGDPSQPHHMRMSDVDAGFGVSEATGSAKSMLIRDLIGIDRFGAEWTLPSRMDANPLIWMLKVNGLMMDIRRCPRDAQVVAFKQGLIPYIPADRENDSTDE